MHHGLLGHPRGAGHGLHGQLGREVAGQTHLHPTVGESLDEKINVGRSAPTQASDGIEQGLLDPEGAADRSENFFHRGNILVRHPGARGISGGALLHEGGRVGHDAHHTALQARCLLQGINGDAGHDGDKQLVGQIRRGCGQGRQRVLGFDAQENDIGRCCDLAITTGHANAAFRAENFSRLGEFVVHDDFRGLAYFGRQNALNKSRGHFSATDESDFHKNERRRAQRPGKRKAHAPTRPGWPRDVESSKLPTTCIPTSFCPWPRPCCTPLLRSA